MYIGAIGESLFEEVTGFSQQPRPN